MLLFKRCLGLVLLSLLVAACSGSPGAAPPTNAPSGFDTAKTVEATRKAAVRFTIRIPKRARRHARFVSPATQSLTLTISPASGGTPVVNKTLNLTPSSPGCSSIASFRQCKVAVSVAPGSYIATVATYDQKDAKGNLLSHAQNVPVSVRAGVANDVGLTLNGIPAGLLIASGSRAIHGTQSAGFTLYGTAPQRLVVVATDADGNAIVGPGGPSYAASVIAGSGWTAGAPASSNPNAVALTPPGTNGAGAVLKLTATYTDNTCAQTGASCSATATVSNDIQTLFVGDETGNYVNTYTLPNVATPAATITSSVSLPDALAVDAYGNLFVANATTYYTQEYHPPYTGAPTAINTGTDSPVTLAVGSNGYLFIGTSSSNNIYVFPPPYTAAIETYAQANAPGDVLADAGGDLFATIPGDSAVREYTFPYALGPPQALITHGLAGPYQAVVDAASDLFVLDGTSDEVLEYAPPFSNASSSILTVNPHTAEADALAIDQNGDIFVAQCSVSCAVLNGTDSVLEYAPPYTGSPVTIANGVSGPQALALDASGNLFVANHKTQSVTEYAPPYTGAPVATIRPTANGPYTLALTP